MINKGVLRVGFHCTRSIPVGLKFSIGTDEEADIVIATKGSELATGILPVHAHLEFNNDCRALGIRAVGDLKLGQTDMVEGDWEALDPHTFLEIVDLQFNVEHMIKNPAMEAPFVKALDQSFIYAGIEPPDTIVSGVPFPGDHTLDTIRYRDGLADGTFASVYEGWSKKGDSRVSKVLDVRVDDQLTWTDKEVRALYRLKGQIGIMEVMQVYNAGYDKVNWEARGPQSVCIVLPKGAPLIEVKWKEDEEGNYNWDLITFLFTQVMLSVMTMHTHMMMHRDITYLNLIFDESASRLVLNDFGKVHFGLCDRDNLLSAWRFMPPQVQKPTAHRRNDTYLYSTGLYIWQAGVSFDRVWFPDAYKQDGEDLDQRQKTKWQITQERLRQDKKCNWLSTIIAKMQAWNENDRLSAFEILQRPETQSDVQAVLAEFDAEKKHVYWEKTSQKQAPVSAKSYKDRHGRKNDKGRSQIPAPDSTTAQPKGQQSSPRTNTGSKSKIPAPSTPKGQQGTKHPAGNAAGKGKQARNKAGQDHIYGLAGQYDRMIRDIERTSPSPKPRPSRKPAVAGLSSKGAPKKKRP